MSVCLMPEFRLGSGVGIKAVVEFLVYNYDMVQKRRWIHTIVTSEFVAVAI